EHARHEYLKEAGIDFKAYAQEGINLVVVRAELDYKFPLESGDRFVVCLNVAKESRLKFAFYQDIFRKRDEKLILNAKITGTALNQRGRPEIPEQLNVLLENKL
ncbi:MAG: acyl-CoA thioesterase, partial [Chlorobium sp.]|nr:acyl-CoA thioesterase [Chlorobium sp.]